MRTALFCGTVSDDGVLNGNAVVGLEFCCFLRFRNEERKPRALIYGGSDLNVAAVQSDDRFNEIQAETHTVFILTAGFIRFIEFLEDHRQFVRGNTVTAVFNADGTYEMKNVLKLGITVDERIADGVYFAKTIKIVKKLLANPELLELPVETPVELD